MPAYRNYYVEERIIRQMFADSARALSAVPGAPGLLNSPNLIADADRKTLEAYGMGTMLAMPRFFLELVLRGNLKRALTESRRDPYDFLTLAAIVTWCEEFLPPMWWGTDDAFMERLKAMNLTYIPSPKMEEPGGQTERERRRYDGKGI